jgi:hypothetical protein
VPTRMAAPISGKAAPRLQVDTGSRSMMLRRP